MDGKEKIDDGSKDNVMFHGMKTPDTLELTEYFDTSDVTDMSSMFQDIRVPTPEEIGVPPKGILRETQNGLIHYEGELGVFDYNPEEFEINRYFTSYLHYCGTGNSVNLPKVVQTHGICFMSVNFQLVFIWGKILTLVKSRICLLCFMGANFQTDLH